MQELIEHFGSQYRLAKMLNVTRAAVSQWVAEGKIPPARAIQIEKLTDGKFKAVELSGGEDGDFSTNER